MKARFAFFASVPLLAIAIVAGCRGSVDRVYDDGIITTLPEAGGADTGGPTTDDAGHGDGGKDRGDGSADGGPIANEASTIRLTVLGLEGNGLVLKNNGGDDLPIPANGAYQFTTKVPPNQPYKVTVANQPSGPSQTCAVVDGEGTTAGKDIENIKVNCQTATFAVGGSVVGLGAGKQVVLQNNGGNDVTVDGDAPFTFPGVASGKNYNVTIKSSTPGTTCNVSGATGTVVGAPVDSVVVNCGANSYTVGGNVTGLSGTLVITNNGVNDRTISANGSYAFSTPITNGGAYKVEVKTQPAFPPVTQVCTVTGGTGTVNVANVTTANIDCVTKKYTVKGTVSGLVGAGLKLQNKGTNDTAINAGATSFSFSTQIASGTSYNVTIATQPAGQTCTVTNPSGTIQSADIGNVAISCAAPIALEEHFDGVTDPALPTGWTTQALIKLGETLANKWTTVSDPGDYQSAPNSAFIENISTYRDVVLISPAFTVASATAKLTFWNHIESEEHWDGGVLEIKIGGTDWQDIVVAGGSFNGGTGYNYKLEGGTGDSSLAGRDAWNGRLTQNASVNLPASCAGKTVQLRWRFASDDGANDNGWWIDDVVVTN